MVRRVAPGTTATDAGRSVRRADRISLSSTWVIPVPVRAPFKYVSMHIMKPPPVGLVAANRRNVFETVVMSIIRPIEIRVTIRIVAVPMQFAGHLAKSMSRLRPRSAGILPLGPPWAIGKTYLQAGVPTCSPVWSASRRKK